MTNVPLRFINALRRLAPVILIGSLAGGMAPPVRADLVDTLATLSSVRSGWDLLEAGIGLYLDTSDEDRVALGRILDISAGVARDQDQVIAELQRLTQGLPGAIEAGFVTDDLVTLRAIIANVDTIIATDPGPAGLEDLRRYAFEADVLVGKIAERGGALAASGLAGALTVQSLLHRLIGTEPARIVALEQRGGQVIAAWLDPGNPGSLAAAEAELTHRFLAASAGAETMRIIPLLRPVWRSPADEVVRSFTLSVVYTGSRTDLFPAWRGTGNPADVDPGRVALAPETLHVGLTFEQAQAGSGIWLRNWISGRLYAWHVLSEGDAALFPCLAPLRADQWHDEAPASADLALWRAGAPGEMVFAEIGLGLLQEPQLMQDPLDPGCVIEHFAGLIATRDRVRADLYALRTVIAELQQFRVALQG